MWESSSLLFSIVCLKQRTRCIRPHASQVPVSWQLWLGACESVAGIAISWLTYLIMHDGSPMPLWELASVCVLYTVVNGALPLLVISCKERLMRSKYRHELNRATASGSSAQSQRHNATSCSAPTGLSSCNDSSSSCAGDSRSIFCSQLSGITDVAAAEGVAARGASTTAVNFSRNNSGVELLCADPNQEAEAAAPVPASAPADPSASVPVSTPSFSTSTSTRQPYVSYRGVTRSRLISVKVGRQSQ